MDNYYITDSLVYPYIITTFLIIPISYIKDSCFSDNYFSISNINLIEVLLCIFYLIDLYFIKIHKDIFGHKIYEYTMFIINAISHYLILYNINNIKTFVLFLCIVKKIELYLMYISNNNTLKYLFFYLVSILIPYLIHQSILFKFVIY